MSERKINTVAVISSAGNEASYSVGEEVYGGQLIKSIELGSQRLNGDPFDHYIVKDNNNLIIATINALCPCVVTYD